MARSARSDLHRRRRGDRRASPRARDGAVSRGGGASARAAEIATAAQLACLLEASAPKPGNVHPGAAFRDTHYEDYLASAAAIGPAVARAGDQPLGRTILDAVTATRRWTTANTNLGIVLLLAPLARAALRPGTAPLRARLPATLTATTARDAPDAYAAIRPAAPGGAGRGRGGHGGRPRGARGVRPWAPRRAQRSEPGGHRRPHDRRRLRRPARAGGAAWPSVASSRSRWRRTTTSSPRRTSSPSLATAARRCTATTTARGSW